jgi:hypothetical protein
MPNATPHLTLVSVMVNDMMVMNYAMMMYDPTCIGGKRQRNHGKADENAKKKRFANCGGHGSSFKN